MNPEARVKPDPRRELPSVDRMVAELQSVLTDVPRWAILEAARRVLAEARAQPQSGEASKQGDPLGDRAGQIARRLASPHPTRVVNATGIVLHTNLGRAPLPADAARGPRVRRCG